MRVIDDVVQQHSHVQKYTTEKMCFIRFENRDVVIKFDKNTLDWIVFDFVRGRQDTHTVFHKNDVIVEMTYDA